MDADVLVPVVAGGFALLGSFLGQYIYAHRLARDAHRDAQLEHLRQDRIRVYSDFAGALIEFRRTQLARWFAEHEGRDTPEAVAAREESRARRGSLILALHWSCTTAIGHHSSLPAIPGSKPSSGSERLNAAPKPPRTVEGRRKGDGRKPSHAKDHSRVGAFMIARVQR